MRSEGCCRMPAEIRRGMKAHPSADLQGDSPGAPLPVWIRKDPRHGGSNVSCPPYFHFTGGSAINWIMLYGSFSIHTLLPQAISSAYCRKTFLEGKAEINIIFTPSFAGPLVNSMSWSSLSCVTGPVETTASTTSSERSSEPYRITSGRETLMSIGRFRLRINARFWYPNRGAVSPR